MRPLLHALPQPWTAGYAAFAKRGTAQRRKPMCSCSSFLPVQCLAVAAALLPALAAPSPGSKDIETPSGVIMILIPAGSFTMGDEKAPPDARPLHEVHVDSFYIDKYEVTQRDYERVLEANPSRWKDPDRPVEQVRWSDAVRYCNARSRLEGLGPAYDLETWECNFDTDGYRLPTEAEWEYAARAGTGTRYFFGDQASKMPVFAWTKQNARGRTHPVGKKHPNPWGLYDIYGNVWEWCHDLYAPDYYKKAGPRNPRGPTTGKTRVVRGGCWNWRAVNCSSGYRYSENPGYSDICFGYDIYGLRPVRRHRVDVGGKEGKWKADL